MPDYAAAAVANNNDNRIFAVKKAPFSNPIQSQFNACAANIVSVMPARNITNSRSDNPAAKPQYHSRISP